LESFHAITIMLQNEDMTFLHVRDIFDNVMLDYPEPAGIVKSPVFEQAVVQIAKGQILTGGKKNCVSCLLLPTSAIFVVMMLLVFWKPQTAALRRKNYPTHRKSRSGGRCQTMAFQNSMSILPFCRDVRINRTTIHYS
jgi:hypothetical protein